MQDVHLSGVDLNLLVPLAALLEERHVSRAARRVGLTQPAMSHALRRLRASLGDELLVRGAGGYVLTPRAERLQRRLATLVPQLEEVFTGEEFDPGVARERFHLAGTDYSAMVLGPALARRALRSSPGSTLRFGPWHGGVFDDLLHGVLDLAFYASSPPTRLRTEELFEERFVCLLDRDHPLAAAEVAPSLEAYLACSHVGVEITDGEQAVLDRHLHAVGTPRELTLTVPYHLAAAAVVARTSFVATLPSRLVARLKIDSRVRTIPAPAEIETMGYLMVWHPRLDDDPAHRWLRTLVRAVAEKL